MAILHKRKFAEFEYDVEVLSSYQLEPTPIDTIDKEIHAQLSIRRKY